MTSLETCWESLKTQQFFGTDLAYYEKGLFSQNLSAIVSVHQILTPCCYFVSVQLSLDDLSR